MNWLLGKYIAFGNNDPKKYPSKPFLDSASDNHSGGSSMSAVEMEEQARRITLLLGGKVKNDKRKIR